MTFDPSKPVQTRNGRPARIICTDAKGDQPIVALITHRDDSEVFQRHNVDGSYWSSNSLSDNDLLNIPVDIVGWINIYRQNPNNVTSALYASRVEAHRNSDRSRKLIACIQVTFKEGDGL